GQSYVEDIMTLYSRSSQATDKGIDPNWFISGIRLDRICLPKQSLLRPANWGSEGPEDSFSENHKDSEESAAPQASSSSDVDHPADLVLTSAGAIENRIESASNDPQRRFRKNQGNSEGRPDDQGSHVYSRDGDDPSGEQGDIEDGLDGGKDTVS